MDRAVLFRFHKDAARCAERVELLDRLNPDVPIYGLGEDIPDLDRVVEAGLADVHVLGDEPPAGYDDAADDWKWRHGDLAIRRWFDAVGRDQSFDQLVLAEWDLVLTAPLADRYGHVPADAVALSGLIPLAEAQAGGWGWATGESREAVEHLREHAREVEAVADPPAYAGVFPGAALSREFLEAYATLESVPALSNDEARVGIYAPALGCPMVDTGFWPGWDDQPDPLFNCLGRELSSERLLEGIRAGDRATFHPYREPLDVEAVLEAAAGE